MPTGGLINIVFYNLYAFIRHYLTKNKKNNTR